jgi:FSR family fosmidomycin resistance protein-like MFS transporter
MTNVAGARQPAPAESSLTATAVPEAQPATDYRRIGVMALAHFINDSYGQYLAILLPVLAVTIGFGLGPATIIVMAYTITSSIIQPLLGHFADRHTTRYISVIGLAATAIGASLMGIAPSYIALMLLAIVAGIGTAAYHPQAAAMVVAVAGRRKATMMSLYLVGGSVGYAIGPTIVNQLVRLNIQATPFLMAPGLLVAGLLAWFAPRNWSPSGAHGEMPSLGRVLYDNRHILALILGVVLLRSWAQMGVSTFLPFFYKDQGFDISRAASVLTVFGLTGAFGGLLGGYLADRFTQKPVIVIPLIAAGPLLLLLPHAGGPLLYVVAALSGILLLSSWNVLTVKAQSLLSKNVAMASGLMLGLSIGMGGLGAIPMGFVADHVGILPVLVFTAALAPLAGLLSLKLPDAPDSSRGA